MITNEDVDEDALSCIKKNISIIKRNYIKR